MTHDYIDDVIQDDIVVSTVLFTTMLRNDVDINVVSRPLTVVV